jgi:hypothetical protein
VVQDLLPRGEKRWPEEDTYFQNQEVGPFLSSTSLFDRLLSFFTVLQIDNKIEKSKATVKEFFDYNVSNLHCVSQVRNFWLNCKA